MTNDKSTTSFVYDGMLMTRGSCAETICSPNSRIDGFLNNVRYNVDTIPGICEMMVIRSEASKLATVSTTHGSITLLSLWAINSGITIG